MLSSWEHSTNMGVGRRNDSGLQEGKGKAAVVVGTGEEATVTR